MPSSPTATAARGGRSGMPVVRDGYPPVPAPAPRTNAAPAPDEQRGIVAETNHDRYRQGLVTDDCVLWDDETLQVGLKAAYAAEDGRVDLEVFFGNKHAGPLQAFDVRYTVDTVDQNALQVRYSAVGPQLGGRLQQGQNVAVQVRGPFQSTPTCCVQFLLPDSTPRALQFRLPVAVSRFLTPVLEMSPEHFFGEWRRDTLQNSEVARVVSIATRLQASLAQLARAVCGPGLGFLTGLDPNPQNVVAAGKWLGPPAVATPPLVLVRLELGQGAARGK